MNNPHLEGLIPDLPQLPKAAACVRQEAIDDADGNDEYRVWDADLADENDALIYTADQMRDYAIDAIRQALAALPGGGVDARQAEIDCIEGWLRMAAEPIGMECCQRGNPMYGCCGDGMPVYASPNEVFEAMNQRRNTLVAELADTPTPNPHEADRNG